MIPDLKEHIRDVVYVLLNNLESKFVSFLKLPHFKELYLKNVVVLKNEAVMYELFERFEEFYLPKDIVTVDVEKYYRLINKLHEHRICCMNKERQNVFLSICIPSYNRGKIVLENVEHLLSCSYDSEIEIIVSNNGSTYEIEEYDTIKNMTDSRVRYHEFKENQGFAANILKICSMANGKYAVIASDEDFMKLESFGDFLNFIKRNAECGIFVSSTNGEAANKHISEGIMGSGLGTIATISTWSYMTGYTYNMEYCRKLKAVELVDSFRCGWPVDWNDEEIMLNRELHINLFLEIFTHVCLAMILCKYVDSAWTRLNIWDTEKHNTKPERKLTLGARPESRIEKQNSCLDFCYQVLRLSKQDFVNMFQYKCKRTHFLIKLSFHAFPDDMSKIGEEQMIHDWIYKEQMRYLDSFPFDLTEEEHSVIQKQILSWE